MDARDPTAQQIQKSHVVLLSLLSFASRILTGLFADFGTSYRIPKTFWAIFGAMVMALSFFVGFRLENINQLFIVTMLCGIAYGTVWTVVPILVGEYFGLVSFAKNWYILLIRGWMTMIPAFGGYVYSSIFAGLYELESKVLCKGSKCYEGSFYFCCITSCVCIVGNLFLFVRRRNHFH
jgi:MFS family permease